jgi:hypothetical protein
MHGVFWAIDDPRMCAACTKRKGKLGTNLHPFPEFDRLEILHRGLCLFHRVKQQSGPVPRCFLPVVKSRILFLKVPGIGQQNAAWVDGRKRCVDRAAKTLLYKSGNPSAVIVRVGEDEAVNLWRIHRKRLPVSSRHSFSPWNSPQSTST